MLAIALATTVQMHHYVTADCCQKTFTMERKSKRPQATPEELAADRDLCARVTAGDREAGREFHERYQRLAGHFALKLWRQIPRRGTVVDFDDIRQEAFEYMLGTAAKYVEQERTMRFGSFTSAFISHRLRRRHEDQEFGVRLPETYSAAYQQIDILNGSRMAHGRRPLSDDDIAEEFGMRAGIDVYRRTRLLRQHLGSIDTGFSPHADDSPGNGYILDDLVGVEPIIGEPQKSPVELAEQSALHDSLEVVLATLTEREASIIRMRFGLDDGEVKTLDEIGDAHRITRERVRQIESKTLAKLNHPSRSRRLHDFMYEE